MSILIHKEKKQNKQKTKITLCVSEDGDSGGTRQDLGLWYEGTSLLHHCRGKSQVSEAKSSW